MKRAEIKKHYEVESMREAWKTAYEIMFAFAPEATEYSKDEFSTNRAGYTIIRNDDADHYYFYICDLGDRLECNVKGKSINVWVKEETIEQKVERLMKEYGVRIA